MIDWLRTSQADPVIELGDVVLPIAIRRHARARRMTMRLAPDGSEVRVTMPRWGQTRDALVFAQARRDWLAQQLAKVPQAAPIQPGAGIAYRGNTLTLEWSDSARRKPSLAGSSLAIGGPLEGLDRRVQRWLEGEAVRLMEDDLAFYCGRAGHAAPAFRLSRAQRRWGSCSGQGTRARCIRVNWRLVQAPDHVRRSVVAHEVAHLTHFDHSPSFHAHLAGLFEGEIAMADSWLKQNGRTLYATFG